MTMAIIMAAGEGTRMNSSRPKVMHEICGYPMIDYVIKAVSAISDYAPVVVVGHGYEEIQNHLGTNVQYAYQKKRLGTGHAVMTARNYLEGKAGYVVVLAGDTPLITANSLREMVEFAREGNYDAVAVSAILQDPSGYGRIVRDDMLNFERIVEHKDATEKERQIKEINASIYCFDIPSLLQGLDKLNNNNAQGEYYLTDVLGILKNSGKRVGVYRVEDSAEISGVNTRIELARADKAMRLRINCAHMENGVTIIDPENTYISPKVEIGKDTVIYPGNMLEGETTIGEGCILYPNSRIVDSKVGRYTQIQLSVILNSEIGEETTVGPFAYIRPGSIIGNRVRIGDFVEIKNSCIGDETKISHLTYVGDGIVGRDVNLGCGVIFVNYDGEKKSTTIVEDHAFVGCNTNLIAPVKVGYNAFVAAGSTVTEDVPEGALAIGRSRQINKEGWVEKRKKERR